MRSDKRAESEDLPREKLVRQILHTSLITSYKNIAEGKIEDMRDGLRDLLKDVQQEFALAQLLLLDERDAVILPLISFPPKIPSNIQDMLVEAEPKVLGWELKKEAFLRRVPKEHDGRFIACIHLTEKEEEEEEKNKRINKKTEEKALPYHYYYTYELSEGTFGEEMGVERVPLPFPVGRELRAWIEKAIIIGKRWPSYGSLPAMSSVLMFTLKPKDSMKELEKQPKEKRLKEFREQLEGNEDDLHLLSWYILYSTFIFQTYALSQASADEPRRLRQELSCVDWLKLLEEAPEDLEKIESRVKSMLALPLPLPQLPRGTSEFEFAKRRVLRKFAEDHPGCSKELCERLVKLMGSSKVEDQNLCYGVLRHLKALYPSITDMADKKECLQAAWSKVKQLLSNWPDPTTFSLPLSAMEDIYGECDSEMQVEICETLINLFQKSIDDEKIVSRRLVESMLVAIARRNKRDSRQFQKLVEVLAKSLLYIKEDEQDKVTECIKRVFATLESSSREEIIRAIEGNSKDIIRLPSEKLLKIDKNLKGLEDISFSPLDATEDKPRLIPVPVVSGKGGVGKTLIALGLSHILASKSKKVCLIELDFFGPTLWYWMNRYIPDKLPKSFLNQYIRDAFNHRKDNAELLPGSERISRLQELKRSIETNLDIILCSVDRELQADVFRVLLRESGSGYIKDELGELLKVLHDENYEYVVFDTPAELKEVTVSIASHSLRYKGVNVFVSTFFDPAVQPLLGSIPLTFAKGNNYLVFNKIRMLDKQYVEDKTAFVDVLGTQWSTNVACNIILSENLIEQVLNVELYSLPWTETLEGFLSISRGSIDNDPWKQIESEEFKTRLGEIAEGLLRVATIGD